MNVEKGFHSITKRRVCPAIEPRTYRMQFCCSVTDSIATKKHTVPWWGKNILRGERGKRVFWEGRGQKYTKYNKINNNSENFRGSKIAASPPAVTLS